MEYIIIGILILLVVLVTISLFKNINEGNITEEIFMILKMILIKILMKILIH